MPISKNNKPSVVLNLPKNEQQSHVAVTKNTVNYEEEDENLKTKESFIVIKLFKSTLNFFFDFLETIVVALSVFVVIYLFVMQPHEVKGSSMEPSFKNNEYIITDKISYRLGEPQRGEVVIFKAPVNPDVDYIKRIIGLPGEKIMISKGKVYINNKLLNEPYLDEITPLFPGGYIEDGEVISIPEDHYFAMGDNRPHSSDSREFGPINKKLIIGKAVFRYWPINELGIVPRISYRLGV